jgi:hypothetical protein
MKVVVTTPDIQGEGGVENYFAVLKDYYSMPVEYFTVGRRDKSSEGHVIGFCHLVSDNFDFRKKMRDDSIALVHLNPSFRQKAIIRDAGIKSLKATFTVGSLDSSERCILRLMQ